MKISFIAALAIALFQAMPVFASSPAESPLVGRWTLDVDTLPMPPEARPKSVHLDFRDAPEPDAEVVLRAEHGVIARVQQCIPDWCRLSVEGEKGWVSTAALWGVDPGEVIE